MKIDFDAIPEYEIFKDLTSLDKMIGFVTIDPTYEPKYFDKSDRQKVFKHLLEYYKENNFQQLQEEYLQLLANKSYSNLSSIEKYNNFVFNHPMIIMLRMFIEQGLLTNDLKINSDVKKLYLGKEVLDRKNARELKIDEGIIFSDGTLLKINSKEAHKLGALWLFLNGKQLHKAIRYTDDCINPEPIFTSMKEYANIKKEDLILSKEQAIAIYNIHLAKSRGYIEFDKILKNSSDLCITPNGNPHVRLSNAKTLERALGKDVFNTREVLEQLRYEATIFRDI